MSPQKQHFIVFNHDGTDRGSREAHHVMLKPLTAGHFDVIQVDIQPG
jgi:hypothetical protein